MLNGVLWRRQGELRLTGFRDGLQLFAAFLSLKGVMNLENAKASEEELVNAARQGDRQAFSHLVERYQNRLYDLACRTLGDSIRAQDAAQEAFLRAWRALPGFKGQSKFSSWLYRIVLNCCYTELRRQGVTVEPTASEPEAELDGLAVRMEIFDRQIDQSDLVERLLKRLTPIYRSIVVMHYLHGLSCDEISSVLNHPVGTVKAYLHRARARMRLEAEALLKLPESA
jgi:RNA polymerase sigma-70 factor (ECF subfamily)